MQQHAMQARATSFMSSCFLDIVHIFKDDLQDESCDNFVCGAGPRDSIVCFKVRIVLRNQ